MSAPLGNKFWTFRDLMARQKKGLTPQELTGAFEEYYLEVEENPLTTEKLFGTKDGVIRGTVELMRAITIQGFCCYIGMSVQTIHNYGKLINKNDLSEEQKKEAQEYFEVVTYIRQFIYNRKYEGAGSGLLKENLIIRDLGLVNKEENTIVVEQPLFPDAFKDERSGDDKGS